MSTGFGAVAGMPPQQAQSPMATTAFATWHSSLTQSFIGRSANMLNRPLPFGPRMTVPSNTKMSSGRRPAMMSFSILVTFSPSSMPSDGCQTMSMPKSVTRSHALGSSAFRNDMVLPLHAPPCSHRRDAIANLRGGEFGFSPSVAAG